MKQINIGLLGLGNIGTGTYKVLEMNREIIRARTGIDPQITRILEIDVERDRGIAIPREKFTQDPNVIWNDPEIDIVIELLGGIEPATGFMLDALRHGKHVVTANKAALAANYEALTVAARENKCLLRYDASVGGAIPILNALTNALLANEFEEITGILNGTTNYILTKMTEDGLAYDDVLKDAQAKGLAEPNPTADVEGIDACNKLSILLSLAFGTRVPPAEIPTTGITGITMEEIEKAKADGGVVKLLATAVRKDGKLSYSVAPEVIPASHPLAGVRNEFCAVFVKGNAIGEMMFYGQGAGPFPTAGAVLGDVIEIGRGIAKNAAYDIYS